MERGSAAQIRSLGVFRKEIARCDQLPPEKAIPILRDAVFKLPKYNIYQLRERIEIFDLARGKLLAIPGHAQYFADLLEAERAALKPGDFRGSYNRHRQWYLYETLRHLPSPETVKVLGVSLYDTRDDIPIEAMPPGELPPAYTTIMAMMALLDLDIRGAPYPPGRFFSFRDKEELATFREWFAPIQTGEKPFSFRGQAVEYRFKLDGTWTSTPIAHPPDDGPKPRPPEAPPRDHSEAPPAPEPPAAAVSAPSLPWPWLAAGTLAILVAAGYFLKSRRRHAA